MIILSVMWVHLQKKKKNKKNQIKLPLNQLWYGDCLPARVPNGYTWNVIRG